MSRAATEWAWRLNLKASQKLLLLSLADRADEHHCCYPSITRLMHDTGLDKKTIGKWINEMIQQGLLIDTGERKGITKRVRVLKLNLDFEFTQKGDRSIKANKPKTGNVPKNGNIPKNGCLNDPKNGSLNQSLEPKNNTHIARSNFESVDNFATAPPPHRSDTLVQTGEGGKAGIFLSSEPPAPELKTRSTQARHKNSVLPDAIERVSTLIALKAGEVQLHEASPACRNKLGAEHRSEKFVMFEGWRPSPELSRTARKIGIELSGPPDQASLAEFIIYWEADGAAYNQIQWEMKLARSLKNQRQRAPKRHRPRRELMASSAMDYTIPEGFRG